MFYDVHCHWGALITGGCIVLFYYKVNAKRIPCGGFILLEQKTDMSICGGGVHEA